MDILQLSVVVVVVGLFCAHEHSNQMKKTRKNGMNRIEMKFNFQTFFQPLNYIIRLHAMQ